MPDNFEIINRVDKLEQRNGEDHKQMRNDIHDLELKYAELKGQLTVIMNTLTEVKINSTNIIEQLNGISSKITKIETLEDNVKELENDVETLSSEDGNTWKNIKSNVTIWIVIILLSLLAASVGLKEFI